MRYFLVVAVLMTLLSCGAKRKLITEIHTTHHIDTSKRQADSLSVKATHSTYASVVQQYEDSSYIVFVSSGGVVQVDSVGRITMQGVASIRTKQTHRQHQNTAVVATYASDSVHTRTEAGVTDSTTAVVSKSIERKGMGVPWLFIAVVGACIIIVLLISARIAKKGVSL